MTRAGVGFGCGRPVNLGAGAASPRIRQPGVLLAPRTGLRMPRRRQNLPMAMLAQSIYLRSRQHRQESAKPMAVRTGAGAPLPRAQGTATDQPGSPAGRANAPSRCRTCGRSLPDRHAERAEVRRPQQLRPKGRRRAPTANDVKPVTPLDPNVGSPEAEKPNIWARAINTSSGMSETAATPWSDSTGRYRPARPLRRGSLIERNLVMATAILPAGHPGTGPSTTAPAQRPHDPLRPASVPVRRSGACGRSGPGRRSRTW